MPDPISWAFAWPYLGAALLFGYLLGSIPFGVVLTRLAGAADPRSVGSGNIGATNVLRTGRKDLAAATLALDLGKGAAAVLIASRWGIDISVMAGFGAMLGHMLPVWLRFRGGKGVATYLGVLAGLFWPAALVFAGLWLVVAYATRYSSLAALLATVTAPFVMWASDEAQLMEVTVIIGLAIFLAHRGNIFRLATGREARIGDDR